MIHSLTYRDVVSTYKFDMFAGEYVGMLEYDPCNYVYYGDTHEEVEENFKKAVDKFYIDLEEEVI